MSSLLSGNLVTLRKIVIDEPFEQVVFVYDIET